MSSLDRINISVIDTEDNDNTPGPNVLAILHEIDAMLGRLLDSGENGAIDIRSLPLMPGDYDALNVALGDGEVVAEIDGGTGPTVISETGISGVWWVSHYGDKDDLMAEFIEITRIPELLISHPDDIEDSREELRMRLAGESGH